MTADIIYNVLLCVEFEDDVLARYRDILGSPQDTDLQMVVSKSGNIVARRYVIRLPGGREIHYNLILAMGGQEAIDIAEDVQAQDEEIVVGFFELRQTDDQFGYSHAIQELRRIFPHITCAVVAPYSADHFSAIAALFESPDEWLYFDRSEISRSELEHTITNLIETFEHNRQLTQALLEVEEGRQGMRQILTGSPDLLKIQGLDDLYATIVRQGAEIARGQNAFLSLRDEDCFRFVAGCGTFVPTEGAATRFKNLANQPIFDHALKTGERQTMPNGTVLPLAIRGKKIGVLYLDGSSTELRDDEILDIFSSQAAFAIENNRLRLDNEAKKALEKELDLAAKIQMSLVPRKFPDVPGLSVYGMMQSAKEIGGDYFDCLILDEGDRREMILAIGDVAGKGVPAGLIMSEVRSFFRSQVPLSPDLRRVMTSIAALIKEDLLSSPGKFLSLLLSRWRFGAGRMEFCSAGHEHILHYRASEGVCKAHRSGGVVLGVPLPAFEKNLAAKALRYHPGDVILFFTDGVTEAVDKKGDMYKLERLIPIVERSADLSVRDMIGAVHEDLTRFGAGAEQRDDITLLAVKVDA